MTSASFRRRLIGALLAIWCAALTGLALNYAPPVMLIAHLVSAALGCLPLAVFLHAHWWQRRVAVVQHANARLGTIALVSLMTLTASGLALLVWTNVPPLRWLHWAAMLLLLLDLTVHMAWRVRQRLALRTPRNPKRNALTLWAGIGLLAVAGVGSVIAATRLSSAASQTTPIKLAHNALQGKQLSSSEDCQNCHTDVSAHWRTSAHAQAVSDVYYQSLAALFIQERGVPAAQYCARCHNPVGLMQGEIDVDAAQRITNPSANTAYKSRQLGVVLPVSDRAAEGVSCAMCHQAAHAAAQPVNGSLQLSAQGNVIAGDVLAQISLRAAPKQHAAHMAGPALKQAELCGACHNLRNPEGTLALEPTFDEWRASPYAERGVTCQTCHMPPRAGRAVNSGLPGQVRAHGGIPGAPSSLPDMADDVSLLRQAATLGVDASTLSRDLQLNVTITNSGAGHYLPTGSDDLRQVWLEVTVLDAAQQVLWQSGQLDAYGELNVDATQFGKTLGDAAGRPIGLHRFWMATQILTDTRLAPLEARRVAYAVPKAAAQQASRVVVRLLYQDVSQAYAEFALDRPVKDLPAREMARVEYVATETQ